MITETGFYNNGGRSGESGGDLIDLSELDPEAEEVWVA